MQAKITSIKTAVTKTNKPMYVCELDNGATLFSFDILDFENNPIIRRTLAGEVIGSYFTFEPAIPVAVIENHKGYLNIIDMEYLQPLHVIKVEPVAYTEKSFQQRAQDSALLTLEMFNNNTDVICFDSETTGLNTDLDEFVSFGIYGEDEEYYTLIKPTARGVIRLESSGAIDIHHITAEMVDDSPTFPNAYRDIYDRLEARIWVVYNAKFLMYRC